MEKIELEFHKKNMMKSFLFTAFAVLMATVATGAVVAKTQPRASVDSGGVTWNYVAYQGTAILTGANPAEGKLTIPSTLDGYPVTTIADSAFRECTNLTSVVIPNGVTSVRDHAFRGCCTLMSVSMPNSLTNIGAYVFYGCNDLASATIPDNMASIGEETFAHCWKLTSVAIPNGMADIAFGLFEDCRALESVSIPESVRNIDWQAFIDCKQLASIAIPDGVQNIESYVFYGCSRLSEVTIPAGVTNIGEKAFSNCSRLETATILSPTAYVDDKAFSGCTGMEKIYVPISWEGTTRLDNAGLSYWTTIVYGEPGKEWVVFDANGGSCATTSQSYELGKAYGTFPEATLTHYSFEGWWTAAEGGTHVTEASFASLEGNRTLYAHWSLAEQVVTFFANGGWMVAGDTSSTTESGVFAVGRGYGSLPEPVRTHHAFGGWWTAAEGGERVDAASVVPATETRQLYAHWILAEQVVTFHPNGGACDTTSRTYSVGGTYSPLPEASMEEYTFAGWWTAGTGGERVLATNAVTATESRALYAHWVPINQEVTFYANGGTCDTLRRVYVVGNPYGWLPDATREGLEFDGWFEWADGGWSQVGEGSVVTEERTRWLCALWKVPGETPREFSVEEFAKDEETGNFTVRFTGKEGKTYLLQRAQRLDGKPDWATVDTLAAIQDGTCRMAALAPSNWAQGFFRVAEAGEDDGWLKSYLAVDMSGGSGALYWPVEELYDMPDGGWTDEYKTTKLLLRLLAPDTFAMGSPTGELGRNSDEAQHDVTLTKPYYIGVFEVTQRQWELATGSNPSAYTGETRPVESASYNAIRGSSAGAGWPGSDEVDAGSFLGVLREKTGLAFDLPTEAEWEYACRAGTPTALNDGNDLSDTSSCTNLAALGRYFHNQGDGLGGTSNQHTEVGSYLPNAWGLYDMHGNVAEWCLDWPASYSGSVTNPAGANSGSYRVCRGGSWNDDARYCRSAARNSSRPHERQAFRGLRVRCPEVETYNVRFDANGGSGEMAAQRYVVGNNRLLPPSGFVLTGHAFAGWSTGATGTVVLADGAGAIELAAEAGDNIILHAVWTPNTYRVRFDANGGTGTMGRQEFTYNEAQALIPNAFSRRGYVCRGWATHADGALAHADGAVVSNLTAAADGDVTLYTVWEPISYRIRFNANGGDGFMADQTCFWNTPVPLQSNAFTRLRHAFAGWATNANGAILYGDGQMVSNLTATAGDTVLLYARWFAYTVQYHSNGGEGEMEAQNFVAGISQRLRTNAFQKPGHVFVGWATSPGGAVEYEDGAVVADLAAVAGNVVHLYAKWSPVYTVRFNANGGGGDMAEQNFTVGVGQALRTNAFERKGYVFEGWATSSDGPVEYADGATVEDLATEPFAFVELYAVWVAGTYLIVDMSAGKVEDTISINDGDFVFGSYGEADLYGSLGELGYYPAAGSTNGVVAPGQALWHLDFGQSDRIVRIELDYYDYIKSIYLISRWGGETVAMDSWYVELDGDRYELRPGESLPEYLRERLLVQLAGLPPVESLSDGQVFWGLDIWPITDDLPVRIGFVEYSGSVGDTRVGAIRRFDPETQETVEQLDHLLVPPNALLDAAWTATSWPVSALKEEPDEGWTWEYKTAKLVLRRIEGEAMPGENPAVGLEVAEPYYIGVFELTQMQAEMVDSNWRENSQYQGVSRPMEMSGTRPDFSRFLGALKTKTGLEFDLPTETQWEYACRAGTEDDSGEGGNLDEMARYWGNGGKWDGHAVVGSYLPNAWGLCDMLGNVWELCQETTSSYVLRGGGWGCDAEYCNPDSRSELGRSVADSSHGIYTYGCRLCLPALP